MGSTLNDLTSGVYGQNTYSVFTGTDIYTVFKNLIISNMQGLSYSVTRQKAPIYCMGSPDPRAIARSKRGIAGSMIMTTFDRHALGGFMDGSQFAAKNNSIETSSLNPYRGEDVTPSGVVDTVQQKSPIEYGTSEFTNTSTIAQTGAELGMSSSSQPLFTDQLLPFDSTLMAANEYGVGSVMRVLGVEVLNEGSGVSIDDTSNEVQMTYICRMLTPWMKSARVTA